MSAPLWSAVLATTGQSPWLRESLEALRQDGGDAVEIVVVDQSATGCAVDDLADHVVRLGRNHGFAVANNRGLAVARGRFLATINDDAIVTPGWSQALLDLITQADDVGAVQGINLQLTTPSLIDGRGLAWSRRWQAVQIDHGAWHPPADDSPNVAPATHEIFGVSATAALYRRGALEAASGTPAGSALREVFDPRLGSYYEDVDLACRLRRQGFRALHTPQATAHHAGSTTAKHHPVRRQALIYGNRYLVLARLLGRAFWTRLPGLWMRDVIDLVHAGRRRQLRKAVGILRGWARAIRCLPRYAHTAQPAPARVGRSDA